MLALHYDSQNLFIAPDSDVIVTVQVVKTSRLRCSLPIAYPVAMETLPAFPHEVWERTPPEAQASIRALEAPVETLASTVHAFQEHVRT